ncbi:MAG TPA: hypothetical protein PLS86_08780, partial [Phycisphaerae bacterium]|nr:hypothetical protein [Phycisphaerae bacterium]
MLVSSENVALALAEPPTAGRRTCINTSGTVGMEIGCYSVRTAGTKPGRYSAGTVGTEPGRYSGGCVGDLIAGHA